MGSATSSAPSSATPSASPSAASPAPVPHPKPAKLTDVAAAAGVSTATASRALSGTGRVSAATRDRVTQLAQELGYAADPIARALRAGSTRTVGIVIPMIGNPHFAELIAAIESELERAGFVLLVADSHGDIAKEAQRLETLASRRIDGLLIVPHDSSRSAPAVAKVMANTPVVAVHRSFSALATDFAGADDEDAMRLVIEHLAEQGVKRVVLVSADDSNSVGRSRRTSFETMTARYGMRTDAHITDEFSVEAGRRAADIIVERGALPDAIVAGSDVNAIGLIARLTQLRVQVPGDVVVTGFDGTQLARLYAPSITTVRDPVEAIAAAAVANLLSRIADSAQPARTTRILGNLIVGGSTGRDA